MPKNENITHGHKKLKSSLNIGVSLLFVSSFVAPAALAQTKFVIEEIVVTVRKQSENLQSTPVTATAFTQTALKNRGIENTADIGFFTPNVVFDTSSSFAGADTFQAFIRGVGQADFALNTDPGVGLYVDGVYYARAPGAVVDLLDITRVEVLKGPQGTLFGRNSIGGAVNIITSRPSDTLQLTGEATFGNFERLEARGAISGPIIENELFASFAFKVATRDGFQERIPFGGTAGLGSTSSASPTAIPLDQLLVSDTNSGRNPGAKSGGTVRGKLLWTPSSDFEISLAIDNTVTRDAANPTTLLEVDPNFALGGLYNACINGAPIPPCSTSPFLQSGANADGSRPDLLFNEQFITGDIDTTFATGANFSNIDNFGISSTVAWVASDAITLKSISAYRELDSAFGLDIDGSPLVFDQTSFTLNTKQFSQELQLNFNFGGVFDGTIGAYYFFEDGEQTDNVPIAGGLIQVGGGFDHDAENIALFGESNYHISDTISLVFGARYTTEEKTLILNQQNFNTEFSTLGLNTDDLPRPDAPQFLGGVDPLTETFDNISIRTGINWQVTDDFYTYFTFSQGFKSGGFTTRLTTFFSPALIAAADPTDPAVLRRLDFEEETSDNFELGFKTSFLENRLRLNAALFYNRYDNIQIVVQRGVSPSNENVAQAEISGLEIELEAVPANWLSVNATLGYINAEYTSIDPAAAPLLFNRFGQQITTDTDLQNTPEITASVAGNVALSDEVVFNINASYTSRVENDVFNTPFISQEPILLMGASLFYEALGSAWSARLGVTNITDERYIISGFEAGSLPFTNGSFNRPREWYLTIGYQF